MRGMVLGFDTATGSGMAATDDGQRFPFSRLDWKAAIEPFGGMKIDFDAADGKASDVYPVPEAGLLGNGIAVKAPQAQQAFKLGAISLGCAIAGVIIPVLGFILAVASLIVGVKAFNQGKVCGEQAGQIMGLIGAVIGGLTLLFYVSSFLFVASIGSGLGMLARM